MANRRIVGGKATPERLQEEYEELLASGKRVSVAEFARRVQIAPTTLAHRYRDYAERIRRLRDKARSQPRRRAPATLSRERITELSAAADLIAQLRRECERLTEECDQLRKRVAQLSQMKEHNERLRGVVVSLQQAIVRELDSDVARRMLDEAEREDTVRVPDTLGGRVQGPSGVVPHVDLRTEVRGVPDERVDNPAS